MKRLDLPRYNPTLARYSWLPYSLLHIHTLRALCLYSLYSEYSELISRDLKKVIIIMLFNEN